MSLERAQDKQKEIVFFDRHAGTEGYDVFTPASNYRLIAVLARLLGLPRGARIADIGCASPFYSPVGVTENERPILGRKVADLFRAQGFRVHTDYLAGLSYRYVASRRARVLLPVYNAIDNGIFRLPFMKPLRAFVLTAGEKTA